mmetsp:Transcript_1231/g.3198  ORF Transcript_1231/g.3198 Transcript_1231/m.3198 type:complete len:233 (-) Transcript_1231:316-1014(-)
METTLARQLGLELPLGLPTPAQAWSRVWGVHLGSAQEQGPAHLHLLAWSRALQVSVGDFASAATTMPCWRGCPLLERQVRRLRQAPPSCQADEGSAAAWPHQASRPRTHLLGRRPPPRPGSPVGPPPRLGHQQTYRVSPTDPRGGQASVRCAPSAPRCVPRESSEIHRQLPASAASVRRVRPPTPPASGAAQAAMEAHWRQGAARGEARRRDRRHPPRRDLSHHRVARRRRP